MALAPDTAPVAPPPPVAPEPAIEIPLAKPAAPLPILFLPDDPPETPAEPVAAPAAPAAVATTTTPPLPTNGSRPPIATEEPREFRRPERQRVQLFGASTFIFLVLCGFGYYKYDEYKNRPPPPPPKLTAQQQKLKEAPASSSNPLNAFKQAKSIINTANQKQLASNQAIHSLESGTPHDPLAAVVGATAAMPPAFSNAGAPASGVAIVTQSTISAPQTDNQVVIDNVAFIAKTADATAPKPNAAFVKWAQKIRIGGMRLSTTPRVFINNMTYLVGDLVDPQLGIVFENYDHRTRFLRFKDRTGAMIEIRH